MPIAIGSRVPSVTFKVIRDGKSADVTSEEVFAGKKVVLFAVPGAFTPTCHLKHLPGFLANLDAFHRKGIDTVACISVNDHHVMNAWAKATGADGRVLMLADSHAAFANAMGTTTDMGPLGVRSERYAALVEDGVIKILNVEDNAGKAETSSAEALLAAMPG